MLAVAVVTPAAAQTTTTLPPVRSIPVAPAPATAAPPAAAPADPLADTGVAADKLVPLAFALIALGALLDASARRWRRPRYSFF